MENLEFKIQLKGGSDTALAFLVAYNKAFKNHRFISSTGIKVRAKGFDAARPGAALKRILRAGEEAHESLIKDGQPVNNDTLKKRIELIRSRIAWAGNELLTWDGSSVHHFPIPDTTNRLSLEKALRVELSKQRPDFKKIIDAHLNAGQNELFGFWQGIIDGQIKPRHGKKLRKSTITAKRQSMIVLKEFDPLASFDKMDMRFYNTFTGWMADQKNKDGSTRFDPNTVGRHIKEIKAVLRLAYANDLMTNTRFEMWPVTKEKNEVVALSKEELLGINNLTKINGKDLSNTLNDVRDIFVMACFLGPRISDFKNLRKESLFTNAGVQYFEYVQEKTGTRVKIPVHPIVQEILNKRAGEFPKMISEQNFRAHLKDICKAAELNDRVITKIRNGKPEYKLKWQAISPHSARRTFASSLFYGWFSKPMPASFCMRYTGHKSEKSFMIYIGASEKDLDAKALEYFDLTPEMKIA
ncbi:phage integrase SAM-like domain-containing protein [Fulvivirgaceae bacterium PWU4]|uniref:Phage integrase SAM-like domain-containing protein n=1 Tax=Chryseosolibacter histidini TaxID=2782349 RepID=A0AAP2DKX8_9BACT|nr:phage integrase SAM-like domain-containing protein [Chryseosolibacter histidini]MBT1698240.1 phage integrase SAM-like domain-containing protein [Chryseosolibacter histidini]